MSSSVVSVPLPNGSIATVSAEDWRSVSRLSWSEKGGGYVHACFNKRAGGDGRAVELGRFIMRPPPDRIVDHIDGNPLNNTRENLQVITQSRNIMRAKQARGSGIQRHKDKWRVRLSVDGKVRSFGVFAVRDDAERALAAAKAQIWGEMNAEDAVA